MTPDMIKLAQRNAKKVGAWNVEFRLGEMEDMPLPDRSVDVIISNCVINLSPDKDAVFREAFRVLRPGGWMAVSDIVLQGELPPSVRDRLDVWASCVAGALDEGDYLDKMRAAGLEGVAVLSRDFVKVSEFPEWENLRRHLEGSGLDVTQIDHQIASVKVRVLSPKHESVLKVLHNRQGVGRRLTGAVCWRVGEEPAIGARNRGGGRRKARCESGPPVGMGAGVCRYAVQPAANMLSRASNAQLSNDRQLRVRLPRPIAMPAPTVLPDGRQRTRSAA